MVCFGGPLTDSPVGSLPSPLPHVPPREAWGERKAGAAPPGGQPESPLHTDGAGQEQYAKSWPRAQGEHEMQTRVPHAEHRDGTITHIPSLEPEASIRLEALPNSKARSPHYSQTHS